MKHSMTYRMKKWKATDHRKRRLTPARILVPAQAAQAQCVSLIINTCSFILRNFKWP